MKNRLINLFGIIAVFLTLAACNQTNKGFVVTGMLHGVEDGAVILIQDWDDPNPPEFELKDGKFEATGKPVSEPTSVRIQIKDKDISFDFFVENGSILYEGEVKEYEEYKGYFYVEPIKIEGSIVNDHQKLIRDKENALYEKYDFSNVAKDEKKALMEKYEIESEAIYLEFIKNNSDTYYASLLAARLAYGKDSEGIKAALSLLDPTVDNSIVRELKVNVINAAETDVDIADAIKANNVSYKVESAFTGKDDTSIIYLGVLSNDNICALTKKGIIRIIDTNGEEVNQFKTEFPAFPTTMAVDNTDKIYVMYPVQEEVETKYRGKMIKRTETTRYECVIFDEEGQKQNSFSLEGVIAATGARVVNNKLMIADYRNRVIGIFNSQTGNKETDIKNMRACCGILDFSVNDNNEILVANLGAYRVQSYDLSGKQILAFGKRGKSLDDFHGCCNPVSVAFLSNGAIVTVEKDPTRIKIYSSEGAKEIEGVEELVVGCSYIPMTVDSKDNIYLSSPEKGLVKCVSI